MYSTPRIPPGGILDPPRGDRDNPIWGMGIFCQRRGPSVALTSPCGQSPIPPPPPLVKPLSVATG
jgi:hypothetical protein